MVSLTIVSDLHLARRVFISRTPDCRRPRGAGFSLVELLVVVGIVMILAALVLGLASLVQERSLRSSCASNLRQMDLVFRMYKDENSDAYPPTLRALYPSYLTDLQILVCPSSGDVAGASINDVANWSSYEYRDGYSPTTMGSTVLREKMLNHGGKRQVLLRDGEIVATKKNGY